MKLRFLFPSPSTQQMWHRKEWEHLKSKLFSFAVCATTHYQSKTVVATAHTIIILLPKTWTLKVMSAKWTKKKKEKKEISMCAIDATSKSGDRLWFSGPTHEYVRSSLCPTEKKVYRRLRLCILIVSISNIECASEWADKIQSIDQKRSMLMRRPIKDE